MFDQYQYKQTVNENICTKKQDNGYEEPWTFLQQANPDKKSLLCLRKADRKAGLFGHSWPVGLMLPPSGSS